MHSGTHDDSTCSILGELSIAYSTEKPRKSQNEKRETERGGNQGTKEKRK